MPSTVKILSLGISQSNFLGQLYGDLQRKFNNYTVSIDKYYDLSQGQVDYEKKIFKEYYNFDKEKVTRYQSIKSFTKLFFTKKFWEIYFFERSQGKSIKESYYFLRSFAYDKVITENYILSSRHNIYHFHYCNPNNLKYLHFFSDDIKVVCSFWGSDLMRETGVDNVFYVSKALQKADIITIQNAELAEMMYCKYGRDLQEKTKIIQFTLHSEIYNFIDDYRSNEEKISHFKIKNEIPLDKIVVAISHNAFEANNHFKIMEALKRISDTHKKEIVLLLPLGYGRSNEYILKLEEYVKSYPVETVLLHKFFGPEETALLRLSTDIMIQMPISDALSGAMTEVLYAGNHVIYGGWLPYGVLRRKGLHFDEIEDFNELPIVIENFLANKNLVKNRNEMNKIKIKSFLFPEKTTTDWNTIFEKLI